MHCLSSPFADICDQCDRASEFTCYLPYSQSCSIFFMCVPATENKKVAQPMQCNAGLFWDQEQSTCNNMSLVSCNARKFTF